MHNEGKVRKNTDTYFTCILASDYDRIFFLYFLAYARASFLCFLKAVIHYTHDHMLFMSKYLLLAIIHCHFSGPRACCCHLTSTVYKATDFCYKITFIFSSSKRSKWSFIQTFDHILYIFSS